MMLFTHIRKALKTARPPLNEQGVTIIEVMLAMSFLALGMLALCALHYSAVRNNTSGNFSTQANALAQIWMESLKNFDLSAAELQLGDHSDANNPITVAEDSGGRYTRSWSVTAFSDFAREVTVTVTWDHNGGSRRVALTSITRGNGI